MRKFEIVKDFAVQYDCKDVQFPQRSTKYSAGYDFFSPTDEVIKPNEVKLIFTNIKAKINKSEFLMLSCRSSMGKRGIIMPNGVGIIDYDYYGNETNDGNIAFMFKNTNTSDFVINKGDKIGQGIIMKYYTVINETNCNNKRIGGFGSTGNKR